jgi:hypothetical protein
MVNGVEVGAICADCKVVLIDEKHVIREHPYVVDKDSVCGNCRDKRLMIARRYGKKVDTGGVHPEVKKAIAESNERKDDKPVEEAKKKEDKKSVSEKPKKKVVTKKAKK